jgi:hypothetical protein
MWMPKLTFNDLSAADRDLLFADARANPGQIWGMPLALVIGRLRAKRDGREWNWRDDVNSLCAKAGWPKLYAEVPLTASEAWAQTETYKRKLIALMLNDPSPAPRPPKSLVPSTEPPAPPLDPAPDHVRWRTCGHEANHALVAMALGLDILSARVDKDGRTGVVSVSAASFDEAPLNDRLCFLLAGPLSDANAGPGIRPFHDGVGEGTDRAQAEALLNEMYRANWHRCQDEQKFKWLAVQDERDRGQSFIDQNAAVRVNLVNVLHRRSLFGGELTRTDLKSVLFRVRTARPCGIA